MNRRWGLCYALLNFKADDKRDVYYLILCSEMLQRCRPRHVASCVGKPDCVICLKYQLLGFFLFYSIIQAICTIVIVYRCRLLSCICVKIQCALFPKYSNFIKNTMIIFHCFTVHLVLFNLLLFQPMHNIYTFKTLKFLY